MEIIALNCNFLYLFIEPRSIWCVIITLWDTNRANAQTLFTSQIHERTATTAIGIFEHWNHIVSRRLT